jgi:hypothetical protein
MSYVYRPSSSSSSSNQGNYGHRGNQHYRSPQETTRSIRKFSGFTAAVGIFAITYLGSQFIAIVLASAGSIGHILLLGISAGSLIITTVIIFKALKDRKVAIILLPVGLLLLSFLSPGLPVLIAVIYIGGSCLYVIYAGASKIVQTRAFALTIVALPLIGGLYYVPTAINNAGLVTKFSTQTPTSIITPQLVRINQVLQKTYPGGAVISYQIRDNRLYADISHNGSVESVAIDTRSLVQTPIPWLERNLSREVGVSLGTGATGLNDPSYARVSKLLAPVVSSLKKFDTVLVADGALINFPHQALLQTGRVFRSVSLDEKQIEQNIGGWAKSPILQPDQFKILNALPQSAEQLQHLDLPGETWDHWQNLHGKFEQAIPAQIINKTQGTNATKAAFLDALQNRQGVVMIVAHSDGFSIRLPTGETVGVRDLEQIKDAIRANRPRVFLFSCETARLNNVQSFAKVLLDYGAEAIAAPVTKLSAQEALDVFQSFLSFTVSTTPMPISEAFERALRETRHKTMEIWIAKVLIDSDMINGSHTYRQNAHMQS